LLTTGVRGCPFPEGTGLLDEHMDKVSFKFLSSLHKSGSQTTPPHQKVAAKTNN